MSNGKQPLKRLGLVIPSANTMTEPQFNRFAPPGVSVHVARVRISYPNGGLIPLPALTPEVVRAAELLADASCDLIVFHCTASSMEVGVAGEKQATTAIEQATRRPATTTASAVSAAFEVIGARKIVLVSPYPKVTNEHEIRFLSECGVEVLHDRALTLPPPEWVTRSGEFWMEQGLAEDDPRADAIFLSCTNIRAIEAVESLEKRAGKPVVTSNQATLWYSLRLMGYSGTVPGLGCLAERGLNPALAAV